MSQPAPSATLRRSAPLLAGAVAISLIAGAVGGVLYKELSEKSGACDATRLATKIQPSLVGITAQPDQPGSMTSGVIIQPDGVILTHATSTLTATGGQLFVLLPNGERLPASVVGSDPVSDLAVIRVDRLQLPATPLSWNQPVRIGEAVLTLGSPLLPDATMPQGTVSAANLTVPAPTAGGGATRLQDMIQLGAPISAALHGGAVVNCDGQLVGIAAKVALDGGRDDPAWSTSNGYAMSASFARRISQELLVGSLPSHPWLGVSVSPVSSDIAARYKTTAGLYVGSVETIGSEATVGLQQGDLITALDGRPATSASWSLLLQTAKISDTVVADIIRAGIPQQLRLTVVEQPGVAR